MPEPIIMPEPVIEQLQEDEDLGMVKITLGNVYGFVSSWHLVETKLNQIRAAYRRINS